MQVVCGHWNDTETSQVTGLILSEMSRWKLIVLWAAAQGDISSTEQLIIPGKWIKLILGEVTLSEGTGHQESRHNPVSCSVLSCCLKGSFLSSVTDCIHVLLLSFSMREKDKCPRYFPSICSLIATFREVDGVTHRGHTIFEGSTLILVPLPPQGSLWGRQQCSLSFTLWNACASIILTITSF